MIKKKINTFLVAFTWRKGAGLVLLGLALNSPILAAGISGGLEKQEIKAKNQSAKAMLILEPTPALLAQVDAEEINSDLETSEESSELADEVEELPAMTVTGQAIGSGYTVPRASTATKTDTPIMETPLSINVVPEQVLQDQGVISLGDALKNVSGVTYDPILGAFATRFLIRGFSAGRKLYRDGFLDSLGNSTFTLANVERIEVIKGPASVLYGRMEPGGLINIVTKQPLFHPYYSLQQQFGSFETYRTVLDVTGPITSDDSLAYRFILEYLNKGSFRNFISTERIFVAPSLTWRPTDQTQIDLEFMYTNEDAAADHGIPFINGEPAPVPISRNFRGPNSFPTSQNEYYSVGLTLSQGITDHWKVKARFQSQIGEGSYGGKPALASLDAATGNATRTFFFAPFDDEAYYGAVQLTGEFATWGLGHTLLLGADYYYTEYFEVERFVSDFPGNEINIFNPVFTADVEALRNSPLTGTFGVKDQWYGIYLQDQIALGEHWRLLAGFRYDWAEASFLCCPPPDSPADPVETESSEFSPRVGLLYHPLPWLSLYGSYSEGYNGENTGLDLSGEPLEPQLSHQYEVGLKVELLNQRLFATLALYELTKTNIKTPIPGRNNRFKVAGEVRHRGIEFDVSGALTDYWHIIASYAYIDSDITKDRDAQGGPGNEGNRLRNVPRHAGSLWTRYDFGRFGWSGLSAGVGVYFVGDRPGDNANTFVLDSYTRVDAMVRYSWNIGPSRLTAQLNVKNLLDEKYFVNTPFGNPLNVLPGAPRTFLGSIKVEF